MAVPPLPVGAFPSVRGWAILCGGRRTSTLVSVNFFTMSLRCQGQFVNFFTKSSGVVAAAGLNLPVPSRGQEFMLTRAGGAFTLKYINKRGVQTTAPSSSDGNSLRASNLLNVRLTGCPPASHCPSLSAGDLRAAVVMLREQTISGASPGGDRLRPLPRQGSPGDSTRCRDGPPGNP